MDFKNILLLFLLTTYSIAQDYQCLDGKSPVFLNTKDYLIQFSKGNCSPVIIIPPLTGTRLFVQILDCNLFKQENPYIFKTCGWTHCEKRSYEFWKKVPKKEYPVWLSNINTPMNILSPFESASNCLAALMNVPVDFTKEAEDALVKTKGYKITFNGNTPGTAKQGECGERACNEIFPDQLQPIIKLEYWKEFLQPMRDKGYQRGLTYQFIPYDFRHSLQNNELNKLFSKNLERIYKITGKKVFIVSLSYGVNNAYYQITRLNKDQKKMVKGLIGMGGNYAGTAMGNFSILAPFNYYGIGSFKLHYKASLFLQSHLPSVYENATQNPFVNFKDHPFLQEIKKRTQYEEGITQTDESIFSEFLPKLNETCSPQNFEHFGNTCKLGILNKDQIVMTFGDEHYTRENLGQMYKKWGNSADIYKLWKQFQAKDFFELKNPGVPIIALTMRTCSTPYKYDMPLDLKKQIKNQKYIDPKITFGYGDSIVDSMSLFVGPLKWAYEYQMQTVPDAQPVKILDVCGLYNQGKDLYDSVNENGEKIMTKNDFIGVNCSCMKDKNPFKCSHGGMFRDPFVGKEFSKIIISNEVSYSQEYEQFINQYNDNELYQMTLDHCPQVRYNYEE